MEVHYEYCRTVPTATPVPGSDDTVVVSVRVALSCLPRRARVLLLSFTSVTTAHAYRTYSSRTCSGYREVSEVVLLALPGRIGGRGGGGVVSALLSIVEFLPHDSVKILRALECAAEMGYVYTVCVLCLLVS